MRYLVTGGAGFIGSHLVEHLTAQGHQVNVIDNLSSGKLENLPKECNFILGDILDPPTLNKAFEGTDGCFHLAAIASITQSIKHWVNTNKVNLVGTINVFEQAAACGVPVVYASSAAVYGNNNTFPLTEDLLPQTLSGYAADKFACELQARAFGEIYNLPTFGLRFFNVYGPRQPFDSSYSGVISIFLHNIKHKQGITIFGDGNQRRDFIHVKDVINFTYAAMQKTMPSAPIANICTGIGTTVNTLAQQLFSILGKVHIDYLPARKGDALISIGSIEKARQLLNLKARVGLEEGLKELALMQ